MSARLLALGTCAALSLGCSLGQGDGDVYSVGGLHATDCWDAAYSMRPDFFAAVPYRSTLQIRVQRGSDLQEVSDGLSVLIDDVDVIRAEKLDVDLSVALPPGVEPPGSPPPEPKPQELAPLVHMALYLQRSCHNQNTVLYAVSGTIKFQALFSGDPNETDAADKYTDAEFDVMVGDPRDAALGDPADAIPPELLSRVRGYFRFYFERGQPGQPFP
ncbi:hypothetical protein SOCE26_086510 [Sorangium cellulosum]|uniref:Uncharacterized protein n=1 Tax=Sorangium cellulosum TaxID=56 RepID=A0A2L0F6S5_SORCE|nr:hypothetical protein [Sorangium cellulosum]AUX47139.1 hypothetical protein SOCE26_086510 [Sorangium cellulosum]